MFRIRPVEPRAVDFGTLPAVFQEATSMAARFPLAACPMRALHQLSVSTHGERGGDYVTEAARCKSGEEAI